MRRGDILDEHNKQSGYNVATDEYLLNAVEHFRQLDNLSTYVVVSNDMNYCRQLFVGPDFVFLDGFTRFIDMAVLSLMDSLILTVGTFGWWSAYLSDADPVFYYSRPFREGSLFHPFLKPDDYFYPTWHGIS